jgi:tetratricopeptide (TPR) repeat protein
MLDVIVLFHLNRPDAARQRLREIGDSGDPLLLAEVAGVEESLGEVQGAIRRYRAALETSGASDLQRTRLLRRIAGLYYEQGDYANALACVGQALGTVDPAAAKGSEPVEVLSLLKLDRRELAKPKVEGLQGGLTAKIVQEIVAADELTTALQRKGYAP